MSREPVFEALEAFVDRWLPLEDMRNAMLAELRQLMVETHPAVKALAAGYGIGERDLQRRLAIGLLRYEINTYGHHGRDCNCDACEFLERVK